MAHNTLSQGLIHEGKEAQPQEEDGEEGGRKDKVK